LSITERATKGLATVLYNPTAGRRRSHLVAEAAQSRLRGSGWEVACFPTEGPGHAAELARTSGAKGRRLIVVGGDGTLREAAEGLLGAAGAVELGFVPMGNANVIARELGISLDPSRAVDLAVAGEARPFDALRVNGRVVLAMIGVGYDGIVTRLVDGARSGRVARRWYRWHADSLYATLGFAALFFPCTRFTLEVDGEVAPIRYRNLVLSNIQTYAKGWAVTPGADPRDGLLDYQARKRTAFPFGVWALAAARMRRRAPGFVARYGRGARFRITGERPFKWQADGDPMGPATELEVDVLPSALRLVGPP
jgi:YegS/Rv2252/BmrU family lipid kinase